MRHQDLFGDRADDYARHRPTYPEALFDHLDRLVIRRDLALDCGAGSGQTAHSLARRFARVLATDPNLRQLAHTRPERGLPLVPTTPEELALSHRRADLVTLSAS